MDFDRVQRQDCSFGRTTGTTVVGVIEVVTEKDSQSGRRGTYNSELCFQCCPYPCLVRPPRYVVAVVVDSNCIKCTHYTAKATAAMAVSTLFLNLAL